MNTPLVSYTAGSVRYVRILILDPQPGFMVNYSVCDCLGALLPPLVDVLLELLVQLALLGLLSGLQEVSISPDGVWLCDIIVHAWYIMFT